MPPLPSVYQAEASLRAYCEKVQHKGWDPWDALASPIFRIFPLNQRLPRWIGGHLIKIAPFNIRPFIGVPKDCFAKGLALYISGYCLREKRKHDPHNLQMIDRLFQRLKEKLITGYSGACWGTNVAYQTRAFFVPSNTPSAVHTAFAVDALLDLHEIQPDDSYLKLADGACQFVLQDLTITQLTEGIRFSYTPQDNSKVINVTALVARMLARTGALTGNTLYLKRSQEAARYVISRQSEDGSWPYGEDPMHQWIDNYHTGFVLDALEDYSTLTGDEEVVETIEKGAEFYRQNLFLEDGTPKFLPTSTYPIDGHCIAQGILTFTRLRHRQPDYIEFAQKIARWGAAYFQHQSGYFYFQRRSIWLNKIPHIRWVQAWMFLALNRLIDALKSDSR
ncbi:hypothetical protein KKA00_00260 [bacterium]|nr:hypothetical protein [bacterium]MBU1882347.1 hypothetical protein [bacterium]